jgi:hypothetical protein
VLVLASLQRTEGAAMSARPTVSASIFAKAKEWFYRFQTGRIDSAQLAPIMRNELTPASVLQEEKVLKACGKPISFEYEKWPRFFEQRTGISYVMILL